MATLALLAGCHDGGPRRLEWSIKFADGTVREQARAVEALILPGGCGSPEATALYAAQVRRTGAGVVMDPPEIGPGLWGFAARARDGSCRVVGYGCEMITLVAGARASVSTTIELRDEGASCAAAQCDDGVCAGGIDGGLADGGIDAPPPPDTGCVDGTGSCIADTFTECIGGTPVDRPCPLGCRPAGDRCARLVPSNVDASLLAAGDPAVFVTADATIDGDACSVSGIMGLTGRTVTMRAGGEACLFAVSQLDVAATLSITGARPVIILSSGPVTISGTIDAAARGTMPGAGGGVGGLGAFDMMMVRAATGPAPGGPGLRGGTSDDGGGGGGGHCGSGGTGGSSAMAMGGRGGVGPTTAALAMLEPLVGGSGGGAGSQTGGVPPSDGGAGGGAIQITSLVSIDVAGIIDASGGGGEGGFATTAGSAGAGGGSGGSILLEAPVVMISGRPRALGGGGGGAGSFTDMMNGVAGQDGLAAMARATGGTAGGLTDGAGGGGGGADILAGDPGQTAPMPPGNGGGGGGGAGCIAVRTRAGTLPGATFNPSLPPGVQAAAVRTE